MNSKLKIGLIVDGEMTSKNVYDLAEWGQLQEDLVISHLVIQEYPKKNLGLRFFFNKLLSSKTYKNIKSYTFPLLEKFDIIFLRNHPLKSNFHKKFDLTKIVKNKINISPIISKNGFSYRYSPADIMKLKLMNFDVLIRCGSGILRGDILNTANFGILSFHHGDHRVNRGGPPGFWEVYYKQDATGFMIQKLTEELDGGDVLLSGSFPTKYCYTLNKYILYEKSNFYMKFLLEKISKTRSMPNHEDSLPYCNILFKVPNIKQQLSYILKLIYLKLVESFGYRLLKKTYRWSVAFSNTDWRNLVLWRGIKIENEPNHFLADPFVIKKNGNTYCFMEDYNAELKRGCITVHQLFDKHAVKLGDAIVEDFHLSFPYLFEYNEKLFMCPETSEKKEIRLYECIDFPLHWKMHKTIMKNVSAADSIIFKKDDLWWLITNIDPANIGEHSSELYIYYSDNPLSEDWISHISNPIFIDSKRARNAGILFHENDIYRVSQRQSFNFYGKSSSINKIIKLDKNTYSEERVVDITPDFFENICGTHHLHSAGGVTVFDFNEFKSYK